MKEDFEGDILLIDTLDGPEMDIKNGLIISDPGFRTAVYLSLFGGNRDDNGEVVNSKTWWGNCLNDVGKNEQMVSSFQSFIKTFPLTTKNILIAESKAEQDLQWFIDEGIADTVTAEITVKTNNSIELNIIIGKSGELIEAGNYSMQWESMRDGIRE